MTPFGLKLRSLREENNLTQAQLAKVLRLSPAYLSALENGNRGLPSVEIVESVCAFFNIIWDDADEIHRSAELSHPKVTIDTSGHKNSDATKVANLLAEKINKLSDDELTKIMEILK